VDQIKAYISAKLEHAQKLLAFQPDGFHINSRWIEMAEAGRKRAKPPSHWIQENFDDIRMAHYFVLYVEPSDHLKGSIFEIGHAVGIGKRCWIAGNAVDGRDENWGAVVRQDGVANEIRVPHKDVLPWGLYRQRIRMVRSLEQAFKEIRQYASQERILDSSGAELPQQVEF
jgi:hypothetical protein